MKKNRIMAFTVAIIMTVTVFIYAFSPAVSAIISKNGSITLHIADSNTGAPLPGATFRLYFFARAYEKNQGIGYSYEIPYDDCNMDMDNLQDAYLPIHLTHFAYTRALKFTVKSSDKNGQLVFENLTPGVYLIVPTGDIPDYFTPSPFVINIPLYDKENKNWVYDINATPKMQIYQTEGTERKTYISVKKIWDTTESHPDSVTVSLLCDFKEFEKVTLSEKNGWSYRWDNLSKKHNWSIVENEVPDGYKVSYEASSNTVTIVNKGKKTAVITTKPDELVDTGQLNWPVPIFSIAGLLLFSIGWAIYNFDKKNGETA